MATRTHLAAVLNGLVRNVDLTADELVLDSVRLGGGSGTLLTKTILDSLIANSHASGSDNQNIIAGSGLSGGGSGSSVTLDVNVDNTTIEINADTLRLKDGAVSAAKLAATAITGQTEETSADNADSILIYDNSGTALKKMTRANFLAGTSTDELVKISANDTTPGYVEAKFVVDNGTNSTNPLEATTLNDGGDEDYRIRFDQSKVDHGSLSGLGDDDHTIYIKADGTRAFSGDQSMGSNQLTNVGDPVSAQDAATKAYVDSLLDGRSWKQSAKAATTAALPAVTYNNGAGTLTADANGALPAQDGVTLSVNDRLVVKDQASGFQNGIYSVTQVGDGSNPFILTRTSDASTALELTGAAVFVEQGTDNGDKQFAQTADSITLGTTALVWVVTSANHFTGHDMIALSGGQISVDLTTDAGLESSNPGNAAGQLRVKLDGATLSRSSSGLKVSTAGVTDNELASNSVTTAKIAADAVTGAKIRLDNNQSLRARNAANSADVNLVKLNASDQFELQQTLLPSTDNTQELGSASKRFNTVYTTEVNAAATSLLLNASNIDANSTNIANLADPTNDQDAATKIYVDNSAATVFATLTAGESFAADTTFVVRWAINGETAERVYKADKDASTSDLFYAIGVVMNATSSVNAGDPIVVKKLGEHTLGSSDTSFSSSDIGKPVFLDASGAWSITAPSTADEAIVRIGMVQSTTKIDVQPQFVAIN